MAVCVSSPVTVTPDSYPTELPRLVSLGNKTYVKQVVRLC